jgi:hypothetical protein
MKASTQAILWLVLRRPQDLYRRLPAEAPLRLTVARIMACKERNLWA